MTLSELLAEAVTAIENKDSPRWRYFAHGRIKLVGPWDIEWHGHRPTWQAIAEPYNATGQGLDRDIEGLGGTPEEALQDLLAKLT